MHLKKINQQTVNNLKRYHKTETERDESRRIINKICDLHLNQSQTKNSISEIVIQDMIKIIHNMIKNGIQMNINWPLSIKNANLNEYLQTDIEDIEYESEKQNLEIS